MKLINLTPHDITICNEAGEIIRTIPASGVVARLSTTIAPIGELDGIPLTETQFGEVQGLPNESESLTDCYNCEKPDNKCVTCEMHVNKYYIVSQLIKSACPNRIDLLVPAEMLRDSKGNIIGCKSLGV